MIWFPGKGVSQDIGEGDKDAEGMVKSSVYFKCSSVGLDFIIFKVTFLKAYFYPSNIKYTDSGWTWKLQKCYSQRS